MCCCHGAVIKSVLCLSRLYLKQLISVDVMFVTCTFFMCDLTFCTITWTPHSSQKHICIMNRGQNCMSLGHGSNFTLTRPPFPSL